MMSVPFLGQGFFVEPGVLWIEINPAELPRSLRQGITCSSLLPAQVVRLEPALQVRRRNPVGALDLVGQQETKQLDPIISLGWQTT